MKKTTVTVTEVTRNLAHCIKRVHFHNRSFVLFQSGKQVARLVPAIEKICTGKELAEAIAEVDLSPTDALAWRKDVLNARKAIKIVEDKRRRF